MNEQKKVLCVIPARGMSTRVPGKNIRSILGRLCLAYTLDHIRACQHPMHTVIYSEDPEIGRVAVELGAIWLPEPQEVAAQDNMMLVLEAATIEMERRVGPFDIIVLAWANAPIQPPRGLDRVLDHLAETGADQVRFVSPVPSHYHPYRAYRVDGTSRATPSCLNNVLVNSQEYPPVYVVVASYWAFMREALRQLAADRAEADARQDLRVLVCGPDEFVDIDTLFDVQWAEFLLSRRAGQTVDGMNEWYP